jgi:glycine/D-amino acid oxidase-like deaminating enzyme
MPETPSAALPIEQASYWLSQRSWTAGEALVGDQRVDVVIVGGGLTGLWTALGLKAIDPGLRVVILEAHSLGYGASGRNAGILLDTIDHSHGLAIHHFGEDEAARLAALGRANLTRMLATLERLGIGCDVERNGSLIVALNAPQLAALEEELECARRLGIDDLVLLDGDATQAEIRSPRYLGALANPASALLDPVKLVTGLGAEARRLGCTIYEETPVRVIERTPQALVVTTATGNLHADRVILATNAYSQLLHPGLRWRYLPLYDYVLVSEPLTTEERGLLGWRGRQGVSDARNFFNYYRLTADDRILFGTSEAFYAGGVGPEHDHSDTHYRALRSSFAELFPALSSLRFSHAWGGPIAATTRFTPFFGKAHGGRLLYALGYTGHGLGTTHLAGQILAELAVGRASALSDLEIVKRPPKPYPPEPFRRWGVALVTRALRQVDAGAEPNLLLRLLDTLGMGLSS